jgi:tetratricopeptide (TPR) repeat protein
MAIKNLVPGLVFILLVVKIYSQSPIAPGIYDQITAAYQQGRLEEAEKQLRSLLQAHPAEVRALSLMGVILDAQKRYAEAETYYLKALKLAPGSTLLENNLGNHYLAQGALDKAQQAFLRTVALEPRHPNANLQLIQIHLQKKEYAAALRRFDRLAAADQSSPSLQLLRARALYGAGQKERAQTLLDRLESQAAGDLRIAFSLGMAYAEMERFTDAEKTFTRVLQADPTNFDVLYNLGTAALHAGHWERAGEIYEKALQQKPHDVDCLMGLALALVAVGKEAQALPFLAQANQLAPVRPDILLLMAQTSSKLGLYNDTVISYEKYLQLKPEDDIALRERGIALVMSFRVQEGVRELERYVLKHPKDAWGHYQLAVALSLEDQAKSLEHVNQALQLDPQFWDARFARGVLYVQLHRPKDAIEDLQAFLSHDPEDVDALEQLGHAYLQNNQPQPAADSLKKAIDRAPGNPEFYLHYMRALRALNRTQEINEALAKFNQLGGIKPKELPPAGRFHFFTLSPAERQARYFDNLQKAIQLRPGDLEPRVLLAEFYLSKKKTKDALLLLDQIQQMSPDLKIQARCGRMLVDYGLYSNALPFLESVIRKEPVPDETFLDHALAVFYTAGADSGLKTLDAIPPPKRNGDYYLLRAQILDSLDKSLEAVGALNQAFRAAPTRPDLYYQACSFLIKHKKYEDCLKLLKQAEQYVPGFPDLMLARAIVLELLNQSYEATEQLAKIQSQRPEWYLPYLIQGIILESQHQAAEAKPLLETAIALGSDDPPAYYHLALAIKDLTPRDNENAYKIISQGLNLDPHDPYIQTLAGKIALDMEDYPVALHHLQEAIRLLPEMAEAHWLLASLYRVSGEEEKQLAELAEVRRLNQLYPPEKQPSMPIQDLFFTVRKPHRSGDNGQ